MRAALPVLLFLAGCDTGTYRPDFDTDAPGSGSSTISEPPPGLECDDPFPTPDPGSEGQGTCVTEVIECGETVRGNNAGGSTVYGAEPGEAFAMCAGGASQTTELEGPERVYELTLPYGTRDLFVRLESCEKSWLFYYQGEPCATSEVLCSYPYEGTWYDQTAEVALQNASTLFFVVEGAANNGGNFQLTVDCYY